MALFNMKKSSRPNAKNRMTCCRPSRIIRGIYKSMSCMTNESSVSLQLILFLFYCSLISNQSYFLVIINLISLVLEIYLFFIVIIDLCHHGSLIFPFILKFSCILLLQIISRSPEGQSSSFCSDTLVRRYLWLAAVEKAVPESLSFIFIIASQSLS